MAWPLRLKMMLLAAIVKHVPAEETSFCRMYVAPAVASVPQLVSEVPDPAALIATVNAWLAVCGEAVESLTWIVNGKLPACVGVPEIWPLDAPSVKPPGSAPELTDHM